MSLQQPDPSRQSDQLGLSAFREPPEDDGLSLEKLSAAFANVAGRHDPYAPVAEQGITPALEIAQEAAVEQSGGTAACDVTPRTILEAMLFVGNPQNEPITAERVAALMRGVRPAEIEELVVELNQHYAANGCPYTIASVGAGYRLELRPEFGPVHEKLLGQGRAVSLTPGALEVLSLVAYNEPQTAEEITTARGGRPSGAVLSQLVRRGLLRIEQTNVAGTRTRSYYTTPRFLKLFKLESLDDLPRGEDLEKR
ncbi:MAG: SMC-Scp complex subunit ScpB [Planctomycetaceae bacterium]|nr:SMC-Scp complex subunit ScpB [Planctomycetaceae bacterium]